MSFEGMMKHTGVLANTGKNVVVVFMSLPDDPEHALVVDTDALPDQYNEALRKIVESVDGQNAANLADILARRMSPDGSNLTLLQKFHSAGRLQKVPVDLVTMTPRKGVNWPLRDVLEAMNASKKEEPLGFDDLDPETRAAVAAEIGKFNVHARNIEGETASGKKAEAANLLRMAEMLEADAHNKRMQAYKIDPSLKRSKTVVAESKVETAAPIATFDDLDPETRAAVKAEIDSFDTKPKAKAKAKKKQPA